MVAGPEAGARDYRQAWMGIVGVLLGTLLGGLVTLGGTWLDNKQELDTHAEDIKRAAYADFVGKSQECREAKVVLLVAAESSDRKAYKEARPVTRQTCAKFYVSLSTILILAEKDSSLASSARQAYNQGISAVSPSKLEDYDSVAVRTQLGEEAKAIVDFIVAARDDLQDE